MPSASWIVGSAWRRSRRRRVGEALCGVVIELDDSDGDEVEWTAAVDDDDSDVVDTSCGPCVALLGDDGESTPTTTSTSTDADEPCLAPPPTSGERTEARTVTSASTKIKLRGDVHKSMSVPHYHMARAAPQGPRGAKRAWRD